MIAAHVRLHDAYDVVCALGLELLRRHAEVVTDAAAVYPAVLDELIPQAWHHVEQYANNRIEADHSQLKHRLRPMRGLRTDRTAQVVIAGHGDLGDDLADRAAGRAEPLGHAPPAQRLPTRYVTALRHPGGACYLVSTRHAHPFPRYPANVPSP